MTSEDARTILPLASTGRIIHTGTAIPDPEPPPGTTVLRDIAFGPDPRQRLDLYLPPNRGMAPLPLVVFAHGGAWVRRDKRAIRVMYVLHQGFALASIGYRLATQDTFPAQIRDFNAGIAHLRATAGTFGIDPERIVLSGASAGAYLANLSALAGSVTEFGPTGPVRGVVSIYGVSDLIAMAGPMLGGIDHDAPDAPATGLLGVPVRERPDLAWQASPLAYVSFDAPPFLILHGDADRVIPFGQSVALDAHLRLAGVRSELVQLRGVGHGDEAFQTGDARKRILTFLRSVT